jgi:two-component system chemotaxis response regulator CheY
MTAPHADISWLSVLVVDDEPQVTRTVKEMLRDMKVTQVFTAKDGREALEMLDAFQEDLNLVITDWNMPRMTGIELLTQVRTVDPDIAFLLLTGRADRESVLEARQQGVSAYLRKPFSAEQLRAKLVILGQHIRLAQKKRAEQQASAPAGEAFPEPPDSSS